MARKRHTAEEIVAKLRQVDVLTSQGRPVAEAVRSIGGDGSYISFLQLRDPVPITAEIFHWRKPQRFSRRQSVIGVLVQSIL